MDRTIQIFQVDAFAERLFEGNPAAVCPLEDWLEDEMLQAIAAENNLSETAFYVERDGLYELRWFTPKSEVAICGHATLAAGFVILTELEPDRDEVRFQTRQVGELAVRRSGDRFRLELPAQVPSRCPAPRGLTDALGYAPTEVWQATKMMAVLESATQVAGIVPELSLIKSLDTYGLIVTAPGDEGSGIDFVSRYFAPYVGILEDPVTGSAHCVLAPYWAQRLGKKMMEARQLSARGGALGVELAGDRVALLGSATLYLRGTLLVP